MTEIHIWFVRGAEYAVYATKMDAEMAARFWFPGEDPDQRYARVSSRALCGAPLHMRELGNAILVEAGRRKK